MFKRRRRKKIASRPFPAEWLAMVERNVPLYGFLPEPDRAELLRHTHVFLAEKRFEGCGGLDITDEVRVTIAAQACVLLLHRRTDYYPGLTTILVYPSSYVAGKAQRFVGGILVEGQDVRLGESWHHGTVVLSWQDVRRGAAHPHDGHNVVFHEFAHQLDSTWGRGDSTPVLQDEASFLAWAEALGRDFERFRRRTEHRRDEVLDDYGATDPAEFFAVATECFFEKPKELRQNYPRLYEELSRFYQQDPAGW
ncbi:MAG: zinc-dependent peptidase [Sedimentisphaerales bacterium]|nr:zinc-dependent peptidase [Sedimentisphaerales bacterium]